jgi:hypothetical protein
MTRPRRRYVLPATHAGAPARDVFLRCHRSERVFHIDDAHLDPCFDLPDEEQGDHTFFSSSMFESWKTDRASIERSGLWNMVAAMLAAECQAFVRWIPPEPSSYGSVSASTAHAVREMGFTGEEFNELVDFFKMLDEWERERRSTVVAPR